MCYPAITRDSLCAERPSETLEGAVTAADVSDSGTVALAARAGFPTDSN